MDSKYLFCPYCGEKILDGALFCAKCGKRLPDSTGNTSTCNTESGSNIKSHDTDDEWNKVPEKSMSPDCDKEGDDFSECSNMPKSAAARNAASIVAFVLGIVSVILSFWFGGMIIAGIITIWIAGACIHNKQGIKWMAITGLVLGIITIVIGIVSIIIRHIG